MTEEQLLELISIDPEICHGQPCIRGTRVLVTVILDSLAAGMSEADILAQYPSLTPDGVRAAAGYGAWLARQEVHPLRRLDGEVQARREPPSCRQVAAQRAWSRRRVGARRAPRRSTGRGRLGRCRVLVTFDLDFADELAYPRGSHAGIMVLRLRSQHSGVVVRVLEQIVSTQDVEAFAGALVVVTDATVRVRRA